MRCDGDVLTSQQLEGLGVWLAMVAVLTLGGSVPCRRAGSEPAARRRAGVWLGTLGKSPPSALPSGSVRSQPPGSVHEDGQISVSLAARGGGLTVVFTARGGTDCSRPCLSSLAGQPVPVSLN